MTAREGSGRTQQKSESEEEEGGGKELGQKIWELVEK